MSWVTVIFSMTASACLTLALIFACIWWQQRNVWASLLIALTAAGTAAAAACNLAVLHADSPAQFAFATRWQQLAFSVAFFALAGFVRLYLRAGRMWLLWVACGLRLLVVVLNISTGKNLNYREISQLRRIPFLGDSVSIAQVSLPNPWILVGQLSLLAMVIFAVDAALTVWHRGDRRLAVIVGGSTALVTLAIAAQTALIVLGIVEWPATPSLFCLVIVAATAYELAREALRATKLARDLSATEAHLTLAGEAANFGVWCLDLIRNDIWVSDRWRTLFGFTKAEPLHLDHLPQRVHPDDRELVLQSAAKAIQSDGPYHIEYRILLPDGRIRWIASQGHYEFDTGGRPVYLRGVALDITHRRQAELEAQANRNEVAHLLRVASLAELSTAMAHELNQPLTAILSNAQAARIIVDQGNAGAEAILPILDDIIADDKRAGEVISRLRLLLKKSDFQPQPLAANELIQEVIKLMHYELMAQAVGVVTEYAPDLPSIRGDRVQLQQVLINLVFNAGDAMSGQPRNARTLTLRSGQTEGNVIEITVADTGTGIPPGGAEKLFEPYHTTKAHGLGLGLSVSRSIVQVHGGRLWAEDLAQGGAAFHFTVPVWKSETPGATAEQR
jgi:two-component system, LuxR family, sensor kinase FixL